MERKNRTVKMTDRTVKALQPEGDGTRIDYYDQDRPNLSIRVGKTGKSWSVWYRIGTQKKRHTLGSFPTLSLAEARLRAKKALAQVYNNEDPAAEKVANRHAITMEVLSRSFIDRYAKKKKKSWREDDRILKRYILPKFRHHRAQDIDRADIIELLEKLAETAPVSANRTLACVRKMFKWAILVGILDKNHHSPCRDVPRPSPESPRDRVLNEDEIRAVWNACEVLDPLMSALFRLRLVTAQRGGEVASMEWSEVDLESGWWVIPAIKAKNKTQHRVPLTTMAVRILESLKRRQRKLENETKRDSKFVFFAPRPASKPHVGEFQKAAQRLRAATAPDEDSEPIDFTPHDLRRTAASMMTSMQIPRSTVAKILNHTDSSVTATTYDKYSYDQEKRDALDAWAKRLTVIISTLKVVNREA